MALVIVRGSGQNSYRMRRGARISSQQPDHCEQLLCYHITPRTGQARFVLLGPSKRRYCDQAAARTCAGVEIGGWSSALTPV